MHLCLSVVAVLYLCRQPSDNAMIFDRCLSVGWSLGAILRLRRKRRAHPIIFFIAAICLLRFALLSALLLRSSSFVDLPPTFCVSRVLACYASVWGPEYLWTIALYWGYKIRNLLEKLENLPLLALVTISVVIVSSFLATQYIVHPNCKAVF